MPELVKKSDDVNLNDEFEKIVPLKFEKLSEESSDEVDHEIAEILSAAQPLKVELNYESENPKPQVEIEKKEIVETLKVNEADEPEKSSEDLKQTSELNVKVESKPIEEEKKESTTVVVEPIVQEKKESRFVVTPNVQETPTKSSEPPPTVCAPKPTEKLVGENLLPKTTPLPLTELIDEEKPPVPIQTYLWEDLKRAKEQVSGDHVCTSICSVPSTLAEFHLLAV